jgi:tetratricopeptide (TPR) repeat protein
MFDFYNAAVECLLDSRTEAAVFFAEKAFLTRKDEEAAILFCRCLFANKDYSRILKKFSNSPNNLKIRDFVSRSKSALGLTDEEIKAQQATAHQTFLAAEALLKNENFEEATAMFLSTLRIDPNFIEAGERLASLQANHAEFLQTNFWWKGYFCMGVQLQEPIITESLDYKITEISRVFSREKRFRQIIDVLDTIEQEEGYVESLVCLKAAVLLNLGKISDLYFYAQTTLKNYPNQASSWYSAGCYYMLVKKFDLARKFFNKATSVDSQLIPAWFAYGHAFSAADEAEQALTIFRTARRLAPNSRLPLLYMARESLRTGSFALAEQYLWIAMSIAAESSAADAAVLGELGTAAFYQKNYTKAAELLKKASEVDSAEPQYQTNLGYALLRLQDFHGAFECFTKTHHSIGIGYCLHALGDLDGAIENYSLDLTEGLPKNMVSRNMTKTLVTMAMSESLNKN